MVFNLQNGVFDSSTTTGTTDYALLGVPTVWNNVMFSAASSLNDGDIVYYRAYSANPTTGALTNDGVEFGQGTYVASGPTLQRTAILRSSNSNNKVSWSAGTRFIELVSLKEIMAFSDGSGATPSDPSVIAWDCRVRASDIAGSDGDSITAFNSIDSNAIAFSGTGTLKTGGNGIGGKKVLRSNGSSLYSSASGGAGLMGDLYMGVVCRFTSFATFNNLLTAGDNSGAGKRRSLMTINNTLFFIDLGAEVPSTTTLSTATDYFLEVRISSNVGVLYVNGAQVASNTMSLDTYSSLALFLFANSGSAEFMTGDIAEAFFLGEAISTVNRAIVLRYVVAQYGISVSALVGNSLAKYDGENQLTASGVFQKDTGEILISDPFIIGGEEPLQVDTEFSTPDAFVSIYGAFAADAGGSEHAFINNYAGRNVFSVWNRDAGAFSAGFYKRPGSVGEQMGAIGIGVNVFPWGRPDGSLYLETSNLHTSGSFGEMVEVQTKASGGVYALRRLMEEAGPITTYRRITTAGDPLQVAQCISAETAQRVNADLTNATTTFSNMTGIVPTFTGAHKYTGRLVIKCNNSFAADGIKFDFNGGTATMTSFWAAASIFASGGTDTPGTVISTSLSGVINWTTLTGETVIEINFSLVTNTGGTWRPRYAGNGMVSGTVTVELGSFLNLDDTP